MKGGGDRGREKRKMGRKGKGERRKGKEKEKLGHCSKTPMDYGEDKFAQMIRVKRALCQGTGQRRRNAYALLQVKQYFRRSGVTRTGFEGDGEEFSRNRDVISRGRQQHLEKSRVKTTWDC